MRATEFEALLRLLGGPDIEFVEDVPVRYVSLPRLIALKRAAGRRKDFDMLAGLEALLEEKERRT